MRQMVIKFHNRIKELEAIKYVEHYLKYQLAPVISGVKPASTLTMSKHNLLGQTWIDFQDEILMELGLSVKTLRESKESFILLFYDLKNIEIVVDDPLVKEFLNKLEYKYKKPDEAITCLVERYNKYHCPHELGIFLGIPLEDVKDFESCTDKKCLLCGYWKVYNNVSWAKTKFSQYDNAKYEMIKNLLVDLESAS